MATGRSSFAKRQRDMAKKAKAAAKRERKLEKGEFDEFDEEEFEGEDDEQGPSLSNEEIMERMAALQTRYDDGQMDLDTFDEERANLMAQMVID